MIKKGNDVIAKKVRLCDNLFSKAMGARLKTLSDELCYLFPFNTSRRMAMDMFFVFKPLDVVLMDEDKIVVELKEGFKPFTFWMSVNKAMYVLELKSGSIKKFKLQFGDKLEFDYP